MLCIFNKIRFSHKRPKWPKGKMVCVPKCLFRERYPQIYGGNYIFRQHSHATINKISKNTSHDRQ